MISTSTLPRPTDFQAVAFPTTTSHVDTSVDSDTLVPLNYFEALARQMSPGRDQQTEGDKFEISFERFVSNFTFEIADMDWSFDRGEISFVLNHENLLFVRASLKGVWEGEPKLFRLKEFDLNLEKKFENPLSVFVSSTLWEMIGLSESIRVNIPALKFEFSASFDLPVKELRILAQERQIAARLLIIEASLGVNLPFPNSYIAAHDVESIAFCYHAIVEREFEWRCNELTFFPLANEIGRSFFPPSDTTFRLEYPTLPEQRTIFGETLELGQFLVRVDRARLMNFEQVMSEMRSLNGEPVRAVIKPEDAKMKYRALNVPFVRTNQFTNNLTSLLGMENKLDQALLKKYFALASATLEGMNETQRLEVMKRPRRSTDHSE